MGAFLVQKRDGEHPYGVSVSRRFTLQIALSLLELIVSSASSVILLSDNIMKVSSTGDIENIETENHHHHHHHHAYAPAIAPARGPVTAPIHAPKRAPAHGPVKAPIHPPKKDPAHAPVHSLPKPPASAPLPPPHGCVARCTSYCKSISPKRACMKSCTACCAKCKCVPGFTKCSSWDSVEIHGHLVKCP